MPNWVFTTITAKEEVIKDMINDNNEATFRKILPMPEDLHKRGTHPEIMTQLEIDKCWEKYHKEKAEGLMNHSIDYPLEVGITQERNDELISEYGVNNWRDWADKYWGTKWDATSDEPYEQENGYISFRTAWRHPEPFIVVLSKKHPEELIEVEWEEEQGFGQVYIIKNGIIIEIKEEWDLPEWGDEEEIGAFTVTECIADGGRADVGVPLFRDGKWYIDWDESQEYDSLKEAEDYLEYLEKHG